MIRLDSPAQLGGTVCLLCLPSLNENDPPTDASEECEVVSYGKEVVKQDPAEPRGN